MTSRPALISHSDRIRLRRFLAACEERLIRDREHLAQLRARLDAAVAVEPDELPEGVATMHTQVRLRDVASGRSHVSTVVLPPDADVAEQGSPLIWATAALIGAREGDEVQWQSGAGMRRLRVEKILYQPEAAQRQRAHARRRSRTRDEPAARNRRPKPAPQR